MRQGLRRLIEQEPDLVVCGEAETVRDAKSLIRELLPEVVIVDISLRQGDGIELVKDTRAHWAAPVPKDKPQLRAQLQDALDCMKKDGTIAKFYEKWFSKKPGPDDLAVVITPGYGVPGMPGYDPTPHDLKCS